MGLLLLINSPLRNLEDRRSAIPTACGTYCCSNPSPVLPSAGQISCESLDLFNGVDLDTLIYKGKRKQYLDEQAIISDLTIVKFLLDENVTITILVRTREDLNNHLLEIPS
jgi:hypothetical protein